MKNHLRDIVGSAGIVFLALGAGMVSRPAGIAVFGAALVLVALFGFRPERKGAANDRGN